MAPLRSSRSTRNQDHQVASRNRPGVVDLDPTEGLPVQKWEQIVVRVNQDPTTEQAAAANVPSGTAATSSAEWSAQFGTPQFPWPEKPLPSFYSQLPSWSQEMLRRARTGNTSAKLSVWDRKTNSWISAAEAEKRHNPLKSVHLNNLDSNAASKQNTVPDSPIHDDDDDHDDKSDDDDVDNGDDDVGPNTTTGMKRRKKYTPEERIFEVKRWIQMPSAVADKVEERKFLADRRPGMPSLYGGAYQNQIFGSMGLNTNGYGFSAANAGYDLGDGGGLGNAGGMLQNEGAATPVRKNMPPKRKKKKGGPGRKKKEDPTAKAAAVNIANTAPQALDGPTEPKPTDHVTPDKAENDGSDSGSEGEGSEEGELDEGGHEKDKSNGLPGNLSAKQESTAVQQYTQQNASAQNLKSGIENTPNEPSVVQECNTVAEVTHSENADASAESVDVVMEDAAAAEVLSPATEVEPTTTAPSVSEKTAESAHPPEPSAHSEETQLPVEDAPATAPLTTLLQDDQHKGTPVVSQAATKPDGATPAPATQSEQLPASEAQQPEAPPSNSTKESATHSPPPPPSSTLEQTNPPLSPAPIPAITEKSTPEPLSASSTTTSDPAPALAATELQPEPETGIRDREPAAPTQAQANLPPIQTTTDDTSAATTPAQAQPQVLEPASPDLLGGLEDELNKNMDEEEKAEKDAEI